MCCILPISFYACMHALWIWKKYEWGDYALVHDHLRVRFSWYAFMWGVGIHLCVSSVRVCMHVGIWMWVLNVYQFGWKNTSIWMHVFGGTHTFIFVCVGLFMCKYMCNYMCMWWMYKCEWGCVCEMYTSVFISWHVCWESVCICVFWGNLYFHFGHIKYEMILEIEISIKEN